MQKVLKGDTVVMRSGADRGKSGTVLKVLPKDEKVVVEGLNLVRKHRKPRRAGEQGQKIEFPRSVRISTVMVRCLECKKPTRVGFRVLETGVKERVCRQCNAVMRSASGTKR